MEARVKELIELGANPNEVGYLFSNFALQDKHELIRWLIAHGAELKCLKTDAHKLLSDAIIKGKFEWAKELIALGADINQGYRSGEPVLWGAWESIQSEKRISDIIKFAQEHGFDFHALSRDGRNILFRCNEAALSSLLDLGLDINHIAYDGNTALLYALECYRGRFAAALIRHEAKTDISNHEGKNLLMNALIAQTNTVDEYNHLRL